MAAGETPTAGYTLVDAHLAYHHDSGGTAWEVFLDGNNPSYVDMPVWYTHNITNIGEDELYTQFWINEWYNPEDGDTYFEEV